MASWWDQIVVFLTGKHVAILGPRAAGKTTLYDYLQHRSVGKTGTRAQTVAPTKRGVIRRKDLKLSLKKGADVPGSDVHYPEWQELVDKADVVFYVFDAHLVRTDADYAARISQDGRELRKWGIEGKVVYLIGTHSDEDQLASECTKAKYADAILELDVIEALRSRVRAKSVGVGDLATNRAAGKLLRQVVQS